MIPTNPDITYLVGGAHEDCRPFKPFNELQCRFLNALSIAIRSSKEAKRYPDIATFGFWCRNANLSMLRDEFEDGYPRLGLGKVFHVAPSNVPVNFAYSYALGLLAGNANYVRLPSKAFPQVEIICRALNEVLALAEFSEIRPLTHLFRYDHSEGITAEISSRCQGRLIWGGDETIRQIRRSPIEVRGVDIAFADRYSFCCLGARSLASMPDKDLNRLAVGFYNDTYLMDQNACSSPHMVVWVGLPDDAAAAKERFWGCLRHIVGEKYQISAKAAVDKHALFCQNAIELECIRGAVVRDTALFRIELDSLPANTDSLRGNCGYFYEFQAKELNAVSHIVNSRFQTLTYYGLEKASLIDFVMTNRLSGIDRIVPVGSALEIGVVWDGYHVIKSLSRIIEVK